MEKGKSQLIKKIEEIYLTTPCEEIRDVIEADILNTLTKIGYGTLVVTLKK